MGLSPQGEGVPLCLVSTHEFAPHFYILAPLIPNNQLLPRGFPTWLLLPSSIF